MGNRDRAIGQVFLQRSLYEIARLQEEKYNRTHPEQEPSTFKLFQQTAFYALSQTVPLTLGDARWSFPAFRREQQSAPPVETWGTAQLSTLLYYTYGFSRYDSGSGAVWPYHRFVASARCLFPTELYLWLPQTEHIPPGIYHYDALHHSLALIRPGHYGEVFNQAMDANLQNCLGILLFAAQFWKTAFKYSNFAYRLCTQEAGMVIGNALMIAGALGLSGRVHYQFLDRVLNHLSGFQSGEESLFAAVPLYGGQEGNEQYTDRLWQKSKAQALLETIPPIRPVHNQTGSLAGEHCTQLVELDQHTFLEETTEIVTITSSEPVECVSLEERLAPPSPEKESAELARALHSRNSGDVDFTPLSLPLTQSAFWEIIHYALSEYNNDLCSNSALSLLQLYIVVNNVTGMEKGIYRFCANCGMLHIVERGDFTLLFQAIQMKTNITSASASFLCFLVGEYEAASHLFGNRAYRILNMETGIVGHRISIMSAAHSLAARYSNSYDVAQCRALLRLTNSLMVPLAELVIGFESPGTHAGERYRLSLRG